VPGSSQQHGHMFSYSTLLFVYLLVGLGPKLQTMGLSRPLTNRHEICTQVWCGIEVENLLSKISLPPLKNLAGEKPQIYLKFSRTAVNQKCITLKWLNVLTNVSSTINALKDGTKVGGMTPQGFNAT